jgi:hypothetical protein
MQTPLKQSILLLALLSIPAFAQIPVPRFGALGTYGEGQRPCLGVEKADLTLGTPIQILKINETTQVHPGLKVGKPLPESTQCEGLSGYEILSDGPMPDFLGRSIAYLGKETVVKKPNRAWLIGTRLVRMTELVGEEGATYTIWSGIPKRSKQLFEIYFGMR